MENLYFSHHVILSSALTIEFISSRTEPSFLESLQSTDINVHPWILTVVFENSKQMVGGRCLCFRRSCVKSLLLHLLQTFNSQPPARFQNSKFVTLLFFTKEEWSSRVRTLDLWVYSRLSTPKTTMFVQFYIIEPSCLNICLWTFQILGHR